MAIKNITKEEDFYNRIKDFRLKVIPMSEEEKKNSLEEWNNFVIEFGSLDKGNYYYREIEGVMQQLEEKLLGKKVEEVVKQGEDITYEDVFPSIEPENVESTNEHEVIVVHSAKPKEVAEFYGHLLGISSWLKETKAKDPYYVYDNINEFNALVVRFNALNTNDEDCIKIMRVLEADINITIAKRQENSLQTPDKLFFNKLRGVLCYVNEKKQTEPGFYYDNETEYKELVSQMGLSVTDSSPYKAECDKILAILNGDLEVVRNRKATPIRTPEVEEFYRHIVGINSWLIETKAKTPGYIWDNVGEFKELVTRFNELGVTDPDCITIMHTLEQDINMVIARDNQKSVIVPPKPDKEEPFKLEPDNDPVFEKKYSDYCGKIKGIIGWLNDEKERTPGFKYDNETEFLGLLKEAGDLGISDPKTLDMLVTLSEDLHGDIIEQQKQGFKWMK